MRQLRRVPMVAVAFFVAIQLVPYGRDHVNPPVISEPSWDRTLTRELAVATCFDCHSNETVWPWYSQIAPISWLLQHDVDEGREKLNFSEFHLRQPKAEEAAETVEDGEMPPSQYLLTHPEARLDETQLAALRLGLARTLGDD